MSDYDGYITLGTDLDLSGVEKKLDQMITLMEKKSEKAGEEASAKMSKKLAAGMTVGISVLTNVVNRLMNVIGNSMDKAISRVDILNNFPRVMGSLGISSDDAAQSIEYLSDKLVGLPTTLDEGAKAVQRFTSANRNVKASTEMYLALNNAILAGGTAPQQQAIAMEQMSQAYAKGKMDYKEWLAIMQTAPAQMRQVGEAMGYTNIEKFGEDLRRGKISMNDFMKTLVTMNKSSVNGFKTLEEQAREGTGGIRTTLTNLKTTIVRSVGEIMQTIGQKNIARFFQNITDTIKALIPYIAAFTKSFMNMISAIVSVIGKIGKAIGSLFGKKAKKNADETSASLGEVSYAVGDIGENAQDSASSAKKLAKELDNLQGFDEMNVLQDKTDTGGSGGTADVDVGGLEALEGLGDFGTDFGEKIKQLTLNVDAFVAALWGIIAAITAFKTLKLLEALGLISLPLATIVKIAAGIGLIVAGIILVVKGVIDYLEDPTWGNFAKILAGIALIVAGVALIFGGIPALITAIILVVAALGLAIYKNWDKIKEVLEKVGKWIDDNIIKPVIDLFKGLWEKIKEIFTPVVNFFGSIIGTIIDNIKISIDNIKQILKLLIDAIKAVFGPIFKWIYDTVIKPVLDKFNELWNKLKDGVKAAVDTIKKYFNDAVNFLKNIISTIISVFKTIGQKVGDVVGSAFKTAINSVLNAIENILNTPIRTINSLIKTINKVPGIDLKTLQTFSLPRLAKGGIINYPSKGVPVGGAIGGESGREGVIPLTDSQQMALLGEAIGKYITINANITNTMNGRVISRELKTIQNQTNFATNGR